METSFVYNSYLDTFELNVMVPAIVTTPRLQHVREQCVPALDPVT